MATPYTPVSCDLYDILTHHLVRKEAVVLVVTDSLGVPAETRGLLSDIRTEEGAEFVYLKDGHRFRLDRIVRVRQAD